MSADLIESEPEVHEARAKMFRALGDPTRLRIFQTLVEAGDPVNVSAICARTDLEPNLVSHHLQCLKNCQLVDAERDGRKMFYEVSRPEAVEMVALADDCLRRGLDSVLGCEIVGREETG